MYIHIHTLYSDTYSITTIHVYAASFGVHSYRLTLDNYINICLRTHPCMKKPERYAKRKSKRSDSAL